MTNSSQFTGLHELLALQFRLHNDFYPRLFELDCFVCVVFWINSKSRASRFKEGSAWGNLMDGYSSPVCPKSTLLLLLPWRNRYCPKQQIILVFKKDKSRCTGSELVFCVIRSKHCWMTRERLKPWILPEIYEKVDWPRTIFWRYAVEIWSFWISHADHFDVEVSNT